MTGVCTGTAAIRCSRGVALVTVLVVTSLVMVMALAVALMVAVHQVTTRHHREGVASWYMARAGLHLAADALASEDWDAVLAGAAWAPFSDGTPDGVRVLDDGTALDLVGETARLTCGRPLVCTDAQVGAVTRDRPWGANNPRWRLFVFGPVRTLATWRFPPPLYLLVWIGDDGREVDGDAELDGVSGQPGAGVVRARARVIGAGGSRRDAEAELVRVCRPVVDGGPCQPGVRVHGLRDIRQAIP